jgi:hypothetical protein
MPNSTSPPVVKVRVENPARVGLAADSMREQGLLPPKRTNADTSTRRRTRGPDNLTMGLRRLADEMGVNPVVIMLQFAAGYVIYKNEDGQLVKEPVSHDHRLLGARESAKYLYPQLKPAEQVVDPSQQAASFSDLAKRVQAKREGRLQDASADAEPTVIGLGTASEFLGQPVIEGHPQHAATLEQNIAILEQVVGRQQLTHNTLDNAGLEVTPEGQRVVEIDGDATEVE